MTRLVRPDDPALWAVATRLVREYAASLDVSLDFQNFEHELTHIRTEYGPPDGVFLLAECQHEYVGCGAVRRFSGCKVPDPHIPQANAVCVMTRKNSHNERRRTTQN